MILFASNVVIAYIDLWIGMTTVSLCVCFSSAMFGGRSTQRHRQMVWGSYLQKITTSQRLALLPGLQLVKLILLRRRLTFTAHSTSRNLSFSSWWCSLCSTYPAFEGYSSFAQRSYGVTPVGHVESILHVHYDHWSQWNISSCHHHWRTEPPNWWRRRMKRALGTLFWSLATSWESSPTKPLPKVAHTLSSDCHTLVRSMDGISLRFSFLYSVFVSGWHIIPYLLTPAGDG